MSWRFGWWEALAFTHRWLGVAGCLLFLVWFVSGLAMMYVRMPEVTAEERFGHLQAIDASAIGVSVADAAARNGASAASVQLSMLGARPVYRFGGRAPATVYADNGERLTEVTTDDALAAARAFAPTGAAAPRYVGLVTEPDQWTLQSRAHLPLHQVALGDGADSNLYVSTATGEVVMDTTARERFWAYIGPVAHWLYLPILRRNGPRWTDVIIWSSIAGCVLCILGLVAGLIRFSPRRRFSLRGAPTMSPYAGWLKWHHYAGLLFGVVTFTWTFSGLLSMGPFPLLSSGGPTAEQRRAVAGAAASGADALTVAAVRSAVLSATSALQPKELSLIQFRGTSYWLASDRPGHHVLIHAKHPDSAPFPRFDDATLEAIAREALPSARIVDTVWLANYDDHYYDRDGARPLPVLRVRYDDPEGTWLYLDPGRGAIASVVRRPDRLNRWLYHGLHSLDFPFLYSSRPAWDILVIALSVGGIVGVGSSLVPTWRRLRRHAARLRR